jgi:CheY-like chemotaxis protein
MLVKGTGALATILIVEDYPVTQRVLSLTLRNNGYETVVAGNGLEALDRMDETPIDLVLTDIAMPEMDGITLLRYLRGDARYEGIPVIMLTASGQDEDRAVALSLGANGFLSKPASSHELIDTVSAFIPQ